MSLPQSSALREAATVSPALAITTAAAFLLAGSFPTWRGPFPDWTSALAATAHILEETGPLVATAAPSAHSYLEQIHGSARAALTRLGSAC